MKLMPKECPHCGNHGSIFYDGMPVSPSGYAEGRICNKCDRTWFNIYNYHHQEDENGTSFGIWNKLREALSRIPMDPSTYDRIMKAIDKEEGLG